MKKLLSILLVASMLLAGCGSKTVEPGDVNQPSTGNEVVDSTPTEAPTPTTPATPTSIPDDAITNIMLENALSGYDSKIDEAVEKTTKEVAKNTAGKIEFDLKLPESLVSESITDVSVDMEFHNREMQEGVIYVDLSLGEEFVAAELYVTDDMNLYIALPDYSDEVIKVPFEITETEDSTISATLTSVESIEFDKLPEIWDNFKKDVLKAVKFESVETDATVGYEDYEFTGTRYVNKLDLEKVIYALEDAKDDMTAAGFPIAESEEIDTEDLPELKFSYYVDGENKAYQLHDDAGTNVTFISTDKGVCLYSYDAEWEEYEVLFYTEKDTDTEGAFYVAMEGMELEGDYTVDDKGWVLSNIDIENVFTIDTFGFRNGALVIEGGMDFDGSIIDLEVEISEEKFFVELMASVEDEEFNVGVEYDEIKFEDFEVPTEYIEGEENIEEWLYNILTENPELAELIEELAGETYEEPAYDEPFYEEPTYNVPDYDTPSYDGEYDSSFADDLLKKSLAVNNLKENGTVFVELYYEKHRDGEPTEHEEHSIVGAQGNKRFEQISTGNLQNYELLKEAYYIMDNDVVLTAESKDYKNWAFESIHVNEFVDRMSLINYDEINFADNYTTYVQESDDYYYVSMSSAWFDADWEEDEFLKSLGIPTGMAYADYTFVFRKSDGALEEYTVKWTLDPTEFSMSINADYVGYVNLEVIVMEPVNGIIIPAEAESGLAKLAN